MEVNRSRSGLTVLIAAWIAFPGHARPPVSGDVLNRIADEGFNHGEVVETAEYLADHIGGRMTNSPAMRTAEGWTQERFKTWGLKNVRTESYDFGRGWWIESSRVRMLTPRTLELRAIPIAWTPPTQGAIAAPVIVAPVRTVRDFPDWKGKLAGKIVLVSWPHALDEDGEAPFRRLDDSAVARHDKYEEPHFDPEEQDKLIDYALFKRRLDAFLAAEGAVASAVMSRHPVRLVHGEGYSYQVGMSPKLPSVELSSEDYRRLARLAKQGEVRLEINSNVHYEDGDTHARNVFADLPGKDAKAGYVMAGAHLDSWVAGDGAADNGVGCAIVMEAARILSAVDVQPKRTIRFALWSGEEQGLLGSSAFIQQHLARRPLSKDPEVAALGPYFGPQSFPVEVLPGYREMVGYFNVDNGSGRFRGLYAEGNFAAMPILKDWLAPFASLGAAAVVAEPTGSTDHELMSRIGLPAFQFLQDPLDYFSNVHHTDADTFDHLRSEDIRQAAVIMATVLLDAANSESALPGKPVPTQPRLTDPFQYKEPSKLP
jgi:carboxypeptidase Q